MRQTSIRRLIGVGISRQSTSGGELAGRWKSAEWRRASVDGRA